MVGRRDVGNTRRGHYYVVMHWISEDSKRQWTHKNK